MTAWRAVRASQPIRRPPLRLIVINSHPEQFGPHSVCPPSDDVDRTPSSLAFRHVGSRICAWFRGGRSGLEGPETGTERHHDHPQTASRRICLVLGCLPDRSCRTCLGAGNRLHPASGFHDHRLRVEPLGGRNHCARHGAAAASHARRHAAARAVWWQAGAGCTAAGSRCWRVRFHDQ